MRVVVGGQRPCKVVFAVCGVDGSLLQPFVLMEAESWGDIRELLEPLLRDAHAARLAAGCTLAESIHVFCSTDTFGKHRRKYLVLRTSIRSATPKAVAVGVCDDPRPLAETILTGEPFHDVIAFQKFDYALRPRLQRHQARPPMSVDAAFSAASPGFPW